MTPTQKQQFADELEALANSSTSKVVARQWLNEICKCFYKYDAFDSSNENEVLWHLIKIFIDKPQIIFEKVAGDFKENLNYVQAFSSAKSMLRIQITQCRRSKDIVS